MKATLLFCLLCSLLCTVYTQPVNNYCDGAIGLDEDFIADPDDCTDNGWRGITVFLTGANPSPNLTGCVLSFSPSVWYRIPANDEEYLLSFKITGTVGSEPAMQVFKGDCDSLIVVEQCDVGYGGPLFLMDIMTEPSESYYIAIGDATNSSDTLRLNWSKREPGTPCIAVDQLRPWYRSGNKPILGPYVPGDTIGFKYKVYFEVDVGVQNCQWMQGVVPVFGKGWDSSSFDAEGRPLNATMNDSPFPAPGVHNASIWDWWTDVHYHHPHCFLNTGDFDSNGSFDMCDARYDPDCLGPGFSGGCCGPCWDQDSGDLLPAGWFASGVNGSCGNLIGWPGVDWGDGASCNGLTGPWEFYFELIVPDIVSANQDIGDFSIVMHTFADGETGSWTGGPSVCSGDYPERYDAPVLIDCIEDDGEATLSGKLLADYDSDCNEDTGEPGLRWKIVAVKNQSGTRLLMTDSQGSFITQIDTGIYWIVPLLDVIEPEQCPDSLLVDLTTPCIHLIYDLSIDDPDLCEDAITMAMTSGPLRICHSTVLTIELSNTGGYEILSPDVMLELDSLLEFISAEIPFEVLGNNSYLLHGVSIPAGFTQRIDVLVKTACDAPFGYIHCSSAMLVDALCTMEEVSDTMCLPNVSAIDPNFKVDSKDFNFGITGIVDHSPIEYQIHFQNTGTATADKVTILDTLPDLLNVATFKYKGSSHGVEISLLDNHILKFFFDNINLPDSIADEPGSHGVVIYEIQPVEGLILGDSFQNSASIYFDFNAPVITNQKRHEVVCHADVEFESTIYADHGADNGAIYLFQFDTIEYTFLWSNGDTTVDLVNVSWGVYTVTLTDPMGCIAILSFEVPISSSVEHFLHTEISLRPNPANDFLYLDFLPAVDEAQIRIVSIDGREYWSENLDDIQTHAIPVSHLPSAIYICMIRTHSEMRIIKFVKT